METTPMNVTTEFTSHMTTLITGAFESLGNLIASPLGGLIIFGIAMSFLWYVKNLSSTRNIR